MNSVKKVRELTDRIMSVFSGDDTTLEIMSALMALYCATGVQHARHIGVSPQDFLVNMLQKMADAYAALTPEQAEGVFPPEES